MMEPYMMEDQCNEPAIFVADLHLPAAILKHVIELLGTINRNQSDWESDVHIQESKILLDMLMQQFERWKKST